MRCKTDWMILSFLTLMILGSSMGIVIGMQNNGLSSLKGSTTTCDCKTCKNDSEAFDECWHLNQPGGLGDLDPNGVAPQPPVPGDPNRPNPHTDPTKYKACSSEYCIKNTIYFAECPEKENSGGCPTKLDWSKWWVHQEIKDGAPDNCNDPNYTIVDAFTPTPCKTYGSTTAPQGTCVADSCDGTVISEFWDHDNDPNTADQKWYEPYRKPRTVCNVVK